MVLTSFAGLLCVAELPLVLFGSGVATVMPFCCQVDLGRRVVTRAEGEEFAIAHGMRYFETSAATGDAVTDAMHFLFEQALLLGSGVRSMFFSFYCFLLRIADALLSSVKLLGIMSWCIPGATIWSWAESCSAACVNLCTVWRRVMLPLLTQS